MATEIARHEKITLTGKLAERYREVGAPSVSTPVTQATKPSLAGSGAAPIRQRTDAAHAPHVAPVNKPVAQSSDTAIDEISGHNVHIDAWLDVWRRDPAALATLRPLAHAVARDPEARVLLEQWVAEGFEPARRIGQHASDHVRTLNIMQNQTRKLALGPRR